MAEVRAARNGGLCRNVSAFSFGYRFPRTRYCGRSLSGDTRYRKPLYREHSIATNSSVFAIPTGMVPVISSRSTLRKEAAWVNSRERQ
jgi:hypothetical protein